MLASNVRQAREAWARIRTLSCNDAMPCKRRIQTVVLHTAVIKLQAEHASIETPGTAHYSAFVAVR
ncbi:hypothetical protein M8R20_28070 [Pseudomonas sp. R2.Fl]|nr:hypothetical protein [Pseudomonas sp. R2.Fl]